MNDIIKRGSFNPNKNIKFGQKKKKVILKYLTECANEIEITWQREKIIKYIFIMNTTPVTY